MALKDENLLVNLGENRKAELRKFSKFHSMTMNEVVRRGVDNLLGLPHESEVGE